jgi:hypothetical protein
MKNDSQTYVRCADCNTYVNTSEQEAHRCKLHTEPLAYVRLEGNPDEGLRVVGPYHTFDDAAFTHNCPTGSWVTPLLTPDTRWASDLVQFARLIDEIIGAVETFPMDKVLESMGLDEDQLQELFDRAQETWELSKKEITS